MNDIKLTLRETQVFREITGFPIQMIPSSGEAANENIDVMMIAGALYYIIHKRDNPSLEWEEVLDLDINVLMEALGEQEEEEEPPPFVSPS